MSNVYKAIIETPADTQTKTYRQFSIEIARDKYDFAYKNANPQTNNANETKGIPETYF